MATAIWQQHQPGRNHRWGWLSLLSWLLVAVVVSAWAGLPSASPAHAHSILRTTSPADHATIGSLPEQVVLTFDQPCLAIGTEVQVNGPNGPANTGPPRLIDTEVRQPLNGGPAGDYTVLWRVTSADGHPVSGTFTFTTREPYKVTPTTNAAAPPSAPPAEPGNSTAPLIVVALGLTTAAAAAVGYRRRRTRRA